MFRSHFNPLRNEFDSNLATTFTLLFLVEVVPHLLECIPQLFHPDHVCCFSQEFGSHEFHKVFKVNMSADCWAEQKKGV